MAQPQRQRPVQIVEEDIDGNVQNLCEAVTIIVVTTVRRAVPAAVGGVKGQGGGCEYLRSPVWRGTCLKLFNLTRVSNRDGCHALCLQEKDGYIWKVSRVRVRAKYRPKKRPAQPEGRSRTGKYLEGA